MKKLLLFYALTFGLLTPTLAFASVSHNYVCSDFVLTQATCSAGTITFSYPGFGGYDAAYDPAGVAFPMTAGQTYYISYTTTQTSTRFDCTGAGSCTVTNSGSVTDLPFGPTGGSPSGIDFILNGSDGTSGVMSNICITDTIGGCSTPPSPPDSGLPAQIAASEVGMASTTGFAIGSVITWSGDNLLKVFIGSGVGVIFELRYWIVAMLIISAVVLFAFRGMRFFKH